MRNSLVGQRAVRFCRWWEPVRSDSFFTGWDYTARWLSRGGSDGLRSLNVRNTIPVDLNSIICTYCGGVPHSNTPINTFLL